MFFSLIGIYGNRISSIGLIALYVFVFNLEDHVAGKEALYNALWFTCGGVWYLLLAISLYTLKPYKVIQQLLGEYLAEVSHYFHLKATFYLPGADENNLYDSLLKSQAMIQRYQDDLREILFKTRQIVNESNVRSRTLMLMFLHSVDLFERIIISQPNYKQLHTDFEKTGILEQYYSCIKSFANDLHIIGLAVQKGEPLRSTTTIDDAINKTQEMYEALRERMLNTENIESFIRLKTIFDSLADIAKRLKQLHSFTMFDKKVNRNYKQEVDVAQFVMHNEIDPKLLFSNLSFNSDNFRHALRLTLALLVGYLVSLFFPLGHGLLDLINHYYNYQTCLQPY